MAILNKIFLLFFILTPERVCAYKNKYPDRNKNILVSIGEHYEIPSEEGMKIQISRKGLIDAQVFPSFIRIVGIKEGLVVLTLSKGQEQYDDYKYFINVRKEEDLPLVSEDLEKLAHAAGLHYSQDHVHITGISKHYLFFYKVKTLCEKKQNCSFDAQLSKEAVINLKNSLEKSIHKDNEIQIQEKGSILLFTPCSDNVKNNDQKKIIEHQIGSEYIRKNVHIACKKDVYTGSFTLFSKMIVMDSSIAKDIGLQSNLLTDANLGLGRPTFSSNLDLNLNAALMNHKAKIVGEPVIYLLSGVEARAESGSEFLVKRHNRDSEDSKNPASYTWKKVGLDLKVKVFPIDESKVRLQYSFLISTPSSKETGIIHRNRLESEIELSLEHSAVVGGIQFKTNGEEKSSIPFLESIPILGPLLKKVGETESESHIFLYFYLTKTEPTVDQLEKGGTL